MAFSFGPSTQTGVTQPSSAFSFGPSSTTTTQQTSAAPPTLFGSTTPSSTGFGFGTASQQQSTPVTSAMASATGSIFGSAPAPFTSGLFGSHAPVSSSGTSLFGAPQSTGTTFGNSQAPAPQNQQTLLSPLPQQQATPVVARGPSISGLMYYNQLPPEMKQAIDTIHESMMRHKKTIFHLQSLGPRLLQKSELMRMGASLNTLPSSATTPLQDKITQMQLQLKRLQHDMERLHTTIQKQRGDTERAVVQATFYATWPVEGLAARKGVILPTPSVQAGIEEEKKNEEILRQQDVQAKIQQALSRGMVAVDRIDRMPSPYFWDTLHDLESRTSKLIEKTGLLQSQLEQQRMRQQWSTASIQDMLETQDILVHRMSRQLDEIQDAMQGIRFRYNQFERGGNVLDMMSQSEQERERVLQEQVLMHYLQAANATSTPGEAIKSSATTTSGTPFVPTTTGTNFGGPTSTSLTPTLGATAAAPTPLAGVPTFSFNTNVAASVTAPAPSTTPLATPATTANLFGAPSVPVSQVPVAFGSSNVSTLSTSNKKTKGTSRSSGRVRR